MALRSEREELLAAWRALAGNEGGEGWRTIPVAPGGACRLLAGRRFPGNDEALLVGFLSAWIPPADQLPQGQGFRVTLANLGHEDGSRVWIALSRQSAGSLDLFAMMADDVVSIMADPRAADDERLLQVFLARIRAWQDFMRRGGDGLLSSDAEIGLFGEIVVLRDLITAGLLGAVALEAWRGPLDGLQDFALGTGAIEVKSTVSASGFPAVIGSLEQLDDSLTRPLFLACVRLALDVSGQTLSELVGEVQHVLRDEPAARALFDSRLLHAGFLDAVADRYTRRFSCAGNRVLRVSDAFPRLTRGNVDIEIRHARYEIDLDLVSAADVGLADALRQLGVIPKWN